MKTATNMVRAAAAMILGLAAGVAMADGLELQQFAIDSNGNVVIASADTHQVLRVEQGGRVTVLAGTGVAGDAGDGGYATDATLQRPSGIAIEADGSILFGDAATGKVRRIDSLSGVISSVATGWFLGGEPSVSDPFVKITSPNTRQSWYELSVKTIRWAHNLGKTASFTLELSRDRGKTWQTIGRNIHGSEYAWRVTCPPTSRARFRVTQEPDQESVRSDSGHRWPSDINDANVELLAAR